MAKKFKIKKTSGGISEDVGFIGVIENSENISLVVTDHLGHILPDGYLISVDKTSLVFTARQDVNPNFGFDLDSQGHVKVKEE